MMARRGLDRGSDQGRHLGVCVWVSDDILSDTIGEIFGFEDRFDGILNFRFEVFVVVEEFFRAS